MLLNSLARRFLLPQAPIFYSPLRYFTGKTESGFKFKTPKMRMRVVNPVSPPPGLDLKIP